MTQEHVTNRSPITPTASPATSPVGEPPAPDQPALAWQRWRPRLSGPILGLLALLALFALLLAWNGQLADFLQWNNLQLLLHDNAVAAIVALGMLLIIISGGIDLSVGSVVALVTVVAIQVYRLTEARTGSVALASLGAVGAGVAIGGLCGLVNGLAVTLLRVTPFVATLGMFSVARGLAIWLSDRVRVAFPGEQPGWVDAVQRAQPAVGLFSPGVWSALLLALLVAALLRYTVFGRYVYAIGSNEATARLCGINSNRYKLGVYVLAGLLTGWAGILVFAQTASGSSDNGIGLELDVIAAVVIGGASLSGGQGTVSGTLLGVLILGILTNGVRFCQVPIEIKYILIGVIVVVNTALSQWQRRQNE